MDDHGLEPESSIRQLVGRSGFMFHKLGLNQSIELSFVIVDVATIIKVEKILNVIDSKLNHLISFLCTSFEASPQDLDEASDSED
jgi:hypothetical protein